MTAMALPPPFLLEASPVREGERVSFTLFISIVLHLVLVLGVGFTAYQNNSIPPTLEITLAQHSSLDLPEHADFLAQNNQQASGTLDQRKELTTDIPAEFADTRINPVKPVPTLQTTSLEKREEKQVVSTTTPQKQNSTKKPEELNPKESVAIKGEQRTVVDYTAELASLQAKLDRQRQQYAKRPRVKTLTSVAAKSSTDAEYLYRWQERIEMMGNLNYPEEARKKKLYGNLRMLVTLLPNGNVAKIEILKSSGHVVLDQAALRIVRMAAPFPSFPDAMKREVDRLEIIRTWRFEKGDIMSTEG
jgi:protein TonB